MNKFKKVYIIDDDKIFHFIIKKFLVKNNIDMNASFFFNGLESIKKIKNDIKLGLDLPDLILLDINMPIMDGWHFLDEFRNYNNGVNKSIQVYMISSSDSIFDINKSREYQDQINKYLLKSTALEDLKKIFE